MTGSRDPRSSGSGVDGATLPFDLDADRLRERLDEPAWACARWLLRAASVGAAEAEGSRAEPAADLPPVDDAGALVRAVGALHEELGRASERGEDASAVADLRRGIRRAAARLTESLVEERVLPWREMLRDVSHDIRQPLNSIIFLVDGLHGEHSGPLEPAQREQLGIVYSAASSLLSLVNDLLDFARMGERELASSEVIFALGSVTGEIRRLVAPLVDHFGVDFEVSLEAAGRRRGDPQVLTRVAVNLVTNAVEAQGQEGSVRLHLEDADDDGSGLRMIVEDRGPGVDPERVRGLLRSRSDQEVTRMLQGRTRGLGLVICGRLVRAADGSVEVERRPEGGTRFVVELPFPDAS